MSIISRIKNRFSEKLSESVKSVIPIFIIVVLLSLTFVPVPSDIMLLFIVGTVMLVVGMMLFSLGSEISMTKIGEQTGAAMTKSKKLPVIVIVSFLTGFIVTAAEPDLQILSSQVPGVSSLLLTLFVSCGVGIFLVVGVVRMLMGIPLTRILIVSYAAIFILSFFVPSGFLPVSFDSGGVTTGPMTVPFIMAFGVGISEIRSDKHAADDSFGLVALCSAGPILAVMILGVIFGSDGANYTETVYSGAADTNELARLFATSLPTYIKEICVSLLPIVCFYFVFKLVFLKNVDKSQIKKIVVGLVYTYIGLVVFLTGVNVGFLPMGIYLGKIIASGNTSYIVIPIAMLIGFFVVRAEPAVYVLNKQVEEMTDGNVSASAMGISLSVGVAVSLGISMLRILFNIPIMYFILPGYAIAFIISFFVPKMYTAIAFDSGGVASGPMTAAFILPFAQGVCTAVGGNIAEDAFGVVAMVAMTPLITIQVLGLVSVINSRRRKSVVVSGVIGLDGFDNNSIIRL